MKLLFLALISLLLVACSSNEAVTDEPFSVHAFKVGKADSLLLEQKGEYMLIDAGEEDDGQDIVDYLKEHDINSLQALIVTHYDKDHVGGADYVVEAVAIEHVYVPNYESDSKQTKQFLQAVDKAGLTLEKLTTATNISLGIASGTIYPPMSLSYSGDNDYSLVVSMAYGETSFLFAGDVEAPRIADMLLDSTIDLQHTFLKVPHHGRFNEQTEALFSAAQPAYALITSSDKNPEADETVAALETVGAKVYTTRAFDVEFVSDGENISVID